MIQLGDIYLDNRGRYLRVDALATTSAACTVIARTVGCDRIAASNTATSMIIDRLKAMTKVDSAPEISPPDHHEIGINQRDQIIVIDGHPVPYAVTASGPRVKGGGDEWTVTVTLSTRAVRNLDSARQADQ